MGYVALTTYLRPSNYSVGHKSLECVPSNRSNYRLSLTLDIDDSELTCCFLSNTSFFLDIQNHNTIVALYKRPAAV